MTEAEAKLIDGAIRWRAMHPAAGPSPYTNDIDAVIQEREDAFRRHPYGSIAESMMVEPRKPEPYGFPEHIDRHGVGQYTRDVCGPAPRGPHQDDSRDFRGPRSSITPRSAAEEAEHWKRRLRMSGGPPPPGD